MIIKKFTQRQIANILGTTHQNISKKNKENKFYLWELKRLYQENILTKEDILRELEE